MERKQLTIGLFGFGCVGAGLYEVLQQTPRLNATIKTICVKDRDKKRALPPERFTYDKNTILNDPSINLVVELIDDAEAAFDIVSTALKNGKNVVSANKKMLATCFSQLMELQQRHKSSLLYEAACCASIPVIRNLEEYYDNDLLESIEGVVNGSTNYILTRIEKERCSYAEALAQAQSLGYAESNPDLDTKGIDAKYKLGLLLVHAFGLATSPHELLNLGIDRLGSPELEYASEKGCRIRLVAHASRSASGKVIAFVLPKFVKRDDKLYEVDDVYNGLKIRSCFSDTQFFEGRGAGAYPTSSAVISDISALGFDYRYEYRKLSTTEQLEDPGEVFLKVLIRCREEQVREVSEVSESVDEIYLRRPESLLVGTVRLNRLFRLLESSAGCSAVLLELLNGFVGNRTVEMALPALEMQG